MFEEFNMIDTGPCRITVVAGGDFGMRVLNGLRREPQRGEYLSLDDDYASAGARAAKSDLLFIVTDRESSQVEARGVEIAVLAKITGCRVVVVVNPASDEHDGRCDPLLEAVDSLIVVSGDCFVPFEESPVSLLSDSDVESYLACMLIREIKTIITVRSFMGFDFADLESLLIKRGMRAYLGIGVAEGVDRGADAAEKALYALKKQIDFSEVSGMLAIIAASNNASNSLSMDDFGGAITLLREKIPEELYLISAVAVNELSWNSVRVMVVGKAR